MKQEECEKLAVWLGYEYRSPRAGEALYGIGNPERMLWFEPNGSLCGHGQRPPDFYADEAANALLLEKMPVGTHLERRDGGWWCYWPELWPAIGSVDRKTAICEAALKRIERGGR